MNAGPTTERVYEALRTHILGGTIRPGERLDPAVLAAPLASSVTPVRDALHRLTGEHLVDTRTGVGFHLPAIDEPALRDRYDWSANLLTMIIRASRTRSARDLPGRSERTDSIAADRSGALFLAMAQRTGNGEHVMAMQQLNDRLYTARLAEPLVLADVGPELDLLALAAQGSEHRSLRRLIQAYHRRRRRYAADIVRAIYRME